MQFTCTCIYIVYNGLSGKIPTENGLLTTLKIFDVKYNDIDGTIPSELCSLTSLTSLFLGYNEFYGTIPSCIGQLQNMLRIFWSNNNFDGTIPLSMSNMTSLERFIIDDNYFTGDTISSVLSTMTNLNMLMLNDNMLDGILDDTFLSNHPNLTILDLSHNNFALPPSQSSLPEHLFSMSALQVLDLSTNNMNGYLPSSISQINTNLQFVSLYGNKIKGSIPSGIANLQNLIHLDLSNNTLTGLIPTEIGDMKNLTYLFLSNNPWLSRGGVPTWVTNLTHLSNLSLRNTNRTGSLPDFINGTSMGQLILLDLGWNSFTGPIPSSFGSLDGLEFLLLNNNLGINGEMPDEFINATALRAIFLDGTNVRGTLDDTVCNLPNFVYLMDGYEENDIDGGGSVVYANCLGSMTLSGSKAITCSCCECCNAMRETGCSNPYLSNLDASWERNFKRVSYTFSNDTTFWDSSLYPNLV